MSYAISHQNKNRVGDSKTSIPDKSSQNVNNSMRNSQDYIIHLQQTIGNQAVQGRMHSNTEFNFGKIGIQPKLKISQPGDIYEQEADRVAEQVMTMCISDPRDYYPGVNAITLLIEKGDDTSLAKAKELAPLVSFAVARRGSISSNNYWDLATVLELACINNDWDLTKKVLPKVVMTATESWMPKTTMDNVILLKARLEKPIKCIM